MDASKNLTRVGEADGSGQMFDRIASRYDLLNRIISFGIDRRWRAQLLRELGQGKTTGTFLDVATGTADVALAIAGRWPEAKVIGLDPSVYATHSMRRSKATLIYKKTKNLRAVQLLLGHTNMSSTVRYLGVEVEDALEIAESIEI